jgi:hypothetical protein
VKKLIPNKNFIVIEEKNDTLLFQNNITEALVSMSKTERDIILYYSRTENIEKTIDFFKKEYEITADDVSQLILKAKDLKLLIPMDYNEIAMNKRTKNFFFTLGVQYLFVKFIFLLNSCFKTNIIPLFNGDILFYKLFSFDLKQSIIKKIFVNQKCQFLLIFFFCFFFIFQICFFFFNKISLIFSGFAYESVGSFNSIFLFILTIIISLFFHELVHYLIYKMYGGTSDEIGFGLMYFVFPVMYTNIINVHFWKNRKHKIILSLSGVLFDISMLLLVSNLLSLNLQPSMFTLCLSYLFFYYIVQIAINLNFFIPGTDGYYVFIDFFKLNRLFGDSYDNFKKLWINLKSFKLKREEINFWKVGYFFMCCSFITLYWSVFILFVTYPLWGEFVH